MSKSSAYDGVPALTAGALTVASSVGTAALYLTLLPLPWQTQEYPAMAVWSLPCAGATAVVSAILRRRLVGRSSVTRAIAAVTFGALIGVGWAFGAYYLSSGWVLAFDAPMLYCWAVGAVAGLTLALFWKGMALRPGAAGKAGTSAA